MMDASGLAIIVIRRLPSTSAIPEGAAAPSASAASTSVTGNMKLTMTARNAARNVVSR